jgi:hypothetical protein
MWESWTLATYMISQGIYTADQLALLSPPQALQAIWGPENYHAYAPNVRTEASRTYIR